MQMTRISVPVTVAEREMLQLSAQKEMRHPRDQARYLLRRAMGLSENQQVEVISKKQNGAGVRQDLASAVP